MLPILLKSGCYGVPYRDCDTCEDVKNAYDANVWLFNATLIKECRNVGATGKNASNL